MKTPAYILDQSRRCVNSFIACDNKDLQPDYRCSRDGKVCRLMAETGCTHREEFPACKDS